MTSRKPQAPPPGETETRPPHEKVRDAGRTQDSETACEEEKIRREQATKPALMPIGDPAGAA